MFSLQPGVLWAFIAMVSWGIGDFLIQRSTRKFGDEIALFCITTFAAIFLFPFVFRELLLLAAFDFRFWLLIGASLVILFAALLDFEALRIGKISVIEPILALEIPVTVALGSFLISERPTPLQGIFLVTLVIGIISVSLRSFRAFRGFRFEKGVLLALLAAVSMGTTNFLFGVGARQTSPLLINWFMSTFIALVMAMVLTKRHEWKALARHWREQKRLIIGVSVMDNLAWVAFTWSTLSIPIAIATGISESYIALAALLGLLWNREKLMRHQKIGLGCAVLSAVVLGMLSEN